MIKESPEISNYDNLILFGGFIDDFYNRFPNIKSFDKNIFLISPINFDYHPNITHFSYEVLYDEYVACLLAYFLSPTFKTKYASLDIGYLSSESNLSEEELEQISLSTNGKNSLIILGSDIYKSNVADNIIRAFNFILSEENFDVAFLDSKKANNNEQTIDEITEIQDDINGLVAYIRYDDKMRLEGSNQFALVGKVTNGDMISLNMDTKELKVKFVLNPKLKGLIGMLFSDIKFESCYYKTTIKR
ncbi:hypothetical protein [Helicobacter ibis]|uniref:Uncharacterized protein n=1 Tax=Helicobacter ibis TaxID=2962633 RepID=A0ABT4VCU5_9HELI|nr:hypothetical protein [Helicobacter ibis]MDA3968528.1 hypothetical protein [Helicobacter ibis]